MTNALKTVSLLNKNNCGPVVAFRPRSTKAHITYRSRWVGGYDGAEYLAPYPAAVAAALQRDLAGEPHGHEPDLETAVDDWLTDCGVGVLDAPETWKRIRKGSRVGG